MEAIRALHQGTEAFAEHFWKTMPGQTRSEMLDLMELLVSNEEFIDLVGPINAKLIAGLTKISMKTLDPSRETPSLLSRYTASLS